MWSALIENVDYMSMINYSSERREMCMMSTLKCGRWNVSSLVNKLKLFGGRLKRCVVKSIKIRIKRERLFICIIFLYSCLCITQNSITYSINKNYYTNFM